MKLKKCPICGVRLLRWWRGGCELHREGLPNITTDQGKADLIRGMRRARSRFMARWVFGAFLLSFGAAWLGFWVVDHSEWFAAGWSMLKGWW